METEKDYFEIETGLTGKKAYEILSSVEGQLSDGMWENSVKMEGYWKFSDIELKDNNVIIKIAKNTYDKTPEYRWSARLKKQEIFKYRYTYNKFLKYGQIKSIKDIKSWFADKIYQIVRSEVKDNLDCSDMKWSKDCQHELKYLGYYEQITIADAHEVYRKLKKQ